MNFSALENVKTVRVCPVTGTSASTLVLGQVMSLPSWYQPGDQRLAHGVAGGWPSHFTLLCLSFPETKDGNCPSPGAAKETHSDVDELLRTVPGREQAIAKGSRARCARQHGGQWGVKADSPARGEATSGGSSVLTAFPPLRRGSQPLEQILSQRWVSWVKTSVPCACRVWRAPPDSGFLGTWPAVLQLPYQRASVPGVPRTPSVLTV